jgi:hypothetical protein
MDVVSTYVTIFLLRKVCLKSYLLAGIKVTFCLIIFMGISVKCIISFFTVLCDLSDTLNAFP